MKTINYSGIIGFHTVGESHNTIHLIQKDGYKINLAGRSSEIALNYPDKKVQVNYWTSKDVTTKENMLERLLKQFYGIDISEQYTTEDNGSMGSSMTGWMPFEVHESFLKFGGHDLIKELGDKNGMYLIIEFNIAD